MSGTISVKSTLGEGSEYTVELELESAEENRKAEAEVESIDLSGRRVLLVEDNDINAEIACLAAGVNAHISKPFTPEGLRKTLDEQILK